MKTYILIPVWRIEDYSTEEPTWKDQSWDIPHYFMKVFHSKKDIEDYLNKYDNPKNLKETEKIIRTRIHKIMLDSIFEKYSNDSKKALTQSNMYRDINWWVITCDDDTSKENRVGLMEKIYDDKTDSSSWKYVSYFGGKVWSDALLFHIGYF